MFAPNIRLSLQVLAGYSVAGLDVYQASGNCRNCSRDIWYPVYGLVGCLVSCAEFPIFALIIASGLIGYRVSGVSACRISGKRFAVQVLGGEC